MTASSRAAHDATAGQYDGAAAAAGWFPEVIFGLCADRLRPGQRVLDVGIGTGLCAAPFAARGLAVWGLDESAAMLAACRARQVAERLVLHDLAVRPWPVPDGSVTHVLASGVAHFLSDLRSFVGECVRVMDGAGVLALTTRVAPDLAASDVVALDAGGVPMVAHAPGYVTALLEGAGLSVTKTVDLLLDADGSPQRHRVTIAGRRSP